MRDEEAGNYKLEFDFGDDKAQESGELVDFGAQESLGPCPMCGAPVYEHGANYVCAHAVPTAQQPTPSCTFKSGQIILQQPIERAQMTRLLQEGKTGLLEKFISNRTRRAFKAFLVWDKEAGKVNFEFEQRDSKYPPRKTAAAKAGAAAKKATKPAAKAAAKAPRKASTASGKQPSAALAAVIGSEPVARPEAVKKLWDYIKAHNLQDPKDKRTIRADDKLRAVFGKDSAGMFELTGLLGAHLG